MDKPWLELGPAWERVYMIPEDVRGLKHVHSTLDAGPPAEYASICDYQKYQ